MSPSESPGVCARIGVPVVVLMGRNKAGFAAAAGAMGLPAAVHLRPPMSVPAGTTNVDQNQPALLSPGQNAFGAKLIPNDVLLLPLAGDMLAVTPANGGSFGAAFAAPVEMATDPRTAAAAASAATPVLIRSLVYKGVVLSRQSSKRKMTE